MIWTLTHVGPIVVRDLVWFIAPFIMPLLDSFFPPKKKAVRKGKPMKAVVRDLSWYLKAIIFCILDGLDGLLTASNMVWLRWSSRSPLRLPRPLQSFRRGYWAREDVLIWATMVIGGGTAGVCLWFILAPTVQ